MIFDGAELHRLRKDQGWSQPKLAMKSGVSQTQISQLERGQARRPGMETVTRLARALGVETDAFMKDEPIVPAVGLEQLDPVLSAVRQVFREVISETERLSATVGGTILVPRVRSIAHASAGDIPRSEIVDWDAVPEEYEGRDIVTVKINGSCLEPDVSTGDIAIVERGRQYQDGETVLVLVGGSTRVKRAVDRGPDGWWLESNEAPIPITNETVFFGVVLDVLRKLKRVPGHGKPREEAPETA